MDLNLLLRVFGRFKFLLLAGVGLATAMAVLSVVRVDFSGSSPLQYRVHESWTSAATLFVTQEGFPWGRSILDEVIEIKPSKNATPSYVPRFGDAGRYSGLAVLYAELAKSDEVRRRVLAGAPPGTSYRPEAVRSSDGSAVLPLIYMQGFGSTPAAAEAIANRASDVFRQFLEREQVANRIPQEKRVELSINSRATPAELVSGRSFVRPIFVFLLVTGVFIAIAFALENLRPAATRPAVHDSEPVVSHPTATRRPA